MLRRGKAYTYGREGVTAVALEQPDRCDPGPTTTQRGHRHDKQARILRRQHSGVQAGTVTLRAEQELQLGTAATPLTRASLAQNTFDRASGHDRQTPCVALYGQVNVVQPLAAADMGGRTGHCHVKAMVWGVGHHGVWGLGAGGGQGVNGRKG